MALSDLTGTTWRLNSELTSYAGGSYYIKTYAVNITTATSLMTIGGETTTSFVVIEIGYDSGGEKNVVWLYTSTPTSYTNRASLAEGNDTKSLPDGWSARYGTTFTITGGTDVTNSALIAWLEGNCENATPAAPAAPDIAISYAGENIVELSEAGTKTLKTAGKYLTDDIVLTYSPSGGGGAEMATVSLISVNDFCPANIYYTDSSMTVQHTTYGSVESVEMPIGSLIYCHGNNGPAFMAQNIGVSQVYAETSPRVLNAIYEVTG